MGAGDWIIATAQVKRLNQANGLPVVVLNRFGVPQWHEVFENNPRIARSPTRKTQRLINASGSRPYIEAKGPKAWKWKRWDIAPGELYFSEAEKEFAAKHAGRILVEPHTKVAGGNKAWIWDRWQELVDRGGDFVQVGPAGTRVLEGVEFVETPTFRHACAVLSGSKVFLGSEGGLGHAAAAVNVPAVILFSEFISPDITGYPTHRNLRHAGPACGSRVPCEGCRRSMELITVDEVSANLEQLL